MFKQSLKLNLNLTVEMMALLYLFVVTEQEVMDMIADSAENDTLLKRDMVFAQLNFILESGIFKLRGGGEKNTSQGTACSYGLRHL